MVGARFVEELLSRGGGDRYDIVMFGDEPTGNYNRILLSGILAGTHELEDTYINPLEWYERNGVTLHAGVRVTAVDRIAEVPAGKFIGCIDTVEEARAATNEPVRRITTTYCPDVGIVSPEKSTDAPAFWTR